MTLADEHDGFDWLTADEADATLTWPRTRSMLREVLDILKTGDAGPVEDVLRVF